MQKNHKITVVTVCYNSASEIEETILSVLSQDYQSMEYIVIDGGSTDGTVDIIKKYSDRIAYWVSEPDGGIYYAMNKAVEHATGDYVNFMNAGDLFFDDNVLSAVFEGKKYVDDVLYGYHILHFKGGYKPHYPSDPNVLNQGMMPFCHQSMFTKTSLLKEQPYDTEYRVFADYVYYRWLFNSGHTFRCVNKFVSVFSVDGVSASMSLAVYYEMCRVHGWKPKLSHFFTLYRKNMWRKVRYCRVKIFVKSLFRPDKYNVNLKRSKQIED